MAVAPSFVLLLLFLLAGTAVINRSDAATPAPSPAGADCTEAIFSLVDCLSYVQDGGTASKPQGTCCSSLKKVVKTHVSCLCDAFANTASFGIALNMTKALALPAACGVSTPPFSKCKMSATAAPAPSPASLFFNGAPGSSPAATSGISGVPAQSPIKANGAVSLQRTLGGPLLLGVALIAAVALPLF